MTLTPQAGLGVSDGIWSWETNPVGRVWNRLEEPKPMPGQEILTTAPTGGVGMESRDKRKTKLII